MENRNYHSRSSRRRSARSRFAAFLDKQGVYLVMILCLGIVGASAYFAFSAEPEPAPQSAVPDPGAAQVQLVEPPKLSVADKVPAPTTTPEPPPMAEKTPVPTPEQETPVQGNSATAKQKAIYPVKGKILRAFSPNDPVYFGTLNAWMVHRGVDIAAENGADVAAALDGTVTSVVNDPETGYTVIIEHEGKISTLYGNLSAPENIRIGQTVRQGDVIGKVGRSAQSEIADESHVHFAYFVSGACKDPAQFCVQP
ncbi:MAG: M23 family metallopeptidase [Clostridia bacterium]|nr:M23 family metallopeptidase [Clostridia bacterium]